MINNKPLDEITEVDFHKVDWNNLQHEDFHLLSAKLIERQKLAKIPAKSLGSKKKLIAVTLRGKNYAIPETIYNRIKGSKSETIKNKIINDIILNYSPLVDL